MDAINNANIIYWSSIKYKYITQSVLALELYIIIYRFNTAAAIKLIIIELLYLPKLLPLTICTNLKSLYKYLIKLNTT